MLMQSALITKRRTSHRRMCALMMSMLEGGGSIKAKGEKRLTLERRKSYNLNQQNNDPDQERSANFNFTEVSKTG
jgi:hypothetical protein